MTTSLPLPQKIVLLSMLLHPVFMLIITGVLFSSGIVPTEPIANELGGIITIPNALFVALVFTALPYALFQRLPFLQVPETDRVFRKSLLLLALLGTPSVIGFLYIFLSRDFTILPILLFFGLPLTVMIATMPWEAIKQSSIPEQESS